MELKTDYTLINDACENVLPGEYKNKVDLILTSPPYDLMRSYQGNAFKFDFDKVADALVPCLKEGAVLVWIPLPAKKSKDKVRLWQERKNEQDRAFQREFLYG